jgi:hypothetical protein
MTSTPDFATYLASLPRILAGAAALFRDTEGHVLLVEPNYREGWAQLCGWSGPTRDAASG